jgi:hypothetical protein
MLIDLLMPLGVLLILLLALRSCLQFIQNWILNRTLREAIEKRPDTVPLLLEKLESMGGEWRQDATAFALVATGFAILAAALLDEGNDRLVMIQFALLPLFVGAALLFHHRFIRKRQA